jgi:hypothetical protein
MQLEREGVMSMPLTTPGAHDPEALALIGRAFDSAWDEVASRSVIADPVGLSKTMSRRIMCAVLVGVRDVDRLTLLALDAVDHQTA